MLYAGAVVIEGLIMWLLASGASGLTVGLTAVVAVVLLLAVDRAVGDRGSETAGPGA